LQPSISVVIPAYNEEERIPPTLERVADYFRAFGRPAEILVVNDGSRDGTARVVRALAGKLSTGQIEIRLLENPGNQGKGYSVRHGMLEARGEWALFSDADRRVPQAARRRRAGRP